MRHRHAALLLLAATLLLLVERCPPCAATDGCLADPSGGSGCDAGAVRAAPVSHSEASLQRLRALFSEYMVSTSRAGAGAAVRPKRRSWSRQRTLVEDGEVPPSSIKYDYKVVTQCLYRPPEEDGQSGRCYLNPAALGLDAFPDFETPVENMLIKARGGAGRGCRQRGARAHTHSDMRIALHGKHGGATYLAA